MAEKQKALKGRQHQTGRGPAGVPQTAKVQGGQAHSGQMGLGPRTPVPRAEGPGRRLGVAVTIVHALLLPSQLPTPGRRGRRPEERLPNCPGHSGAGCGMRVLRGQQPLSPIPLLSSGPAQSPCVWRLQGLFLSEETEGHTSPH